MQWNSDNVHWKQRKKYVEMLRSRKWNQSLHWCRFSDDPCEK